MIFYPYAKLTLPDNRWQVMKYNVVSRDWDYLPPVYDNEDECQQFVNEHNLDSGVVVIEP